MSEKSHIQLSTESIIKVPLQTYEKFIFIINGEKFITNRLTSDLLSPKICKIHTIDPTVDEFIMNTKEQGDFSVFLNLLNFKLHEINETSIPFIAEVAEILGNESIALSIANNNVELNEGNVIQLLHKHEQYPNTYSAIINKEVDFVSSHFYKIFEKNGIDMADLKIETIEKIITNQNIKLNDEDQLLRFVNQLYSRNSAFSILYEFVYFASASSKSIGEFLEIFDIQDITSQTWKSISQRLKQDIQNQNEDSSRYLKLDNFFPFKSDKKFDGILSHFVKELGNNIESKVAITASSTYSQDYSRQKVVLYNDQSFFYSNNYPNSWICFDFKDHKVKVSNYTIKASTKSANYEHPKAWIIEGSNDNSSWIKIDEQNNCAFLNGPNLVHTFAIQNHQNQEFRYIRMKQIVNWRGDHNLAIGCFEIYGYLI